jgi:hypothetical protein
VTVWVHSAVLYCIQTDRMTVVCGSHSQGRRAVAGEHYVNRNMTGLTFKWCNGLPKHEMDAGAFSMTLLFSRIVYVFLWETKSFSRTALFVTNSAANWPPAPCSRQSHGQCGEVQNSNNNEMCQNAGGHKTDCSDTQLQTQLPVLWKRDFPCTATLFLSLWLSTF